MSATAPVLEFDAARPRRRERALDDLRGGLERWRLAWALARSDVTNRYRGSVLGPLWLTLSTGVMILGLGLLYSTLFRMDVQDYLPWLAVSLIVWNLIAQVINDACVALTSAEAVIRQVPLPHSVHGLRATVRNLLIAAHNLPLIAVVMAIFGVAPGPGIVLLPVGLFLVALNSFAASMLLGMVCARFRDIGPIVGSVMQLAFFMTPVIWKPELLGALAPLQLLNPFYTVMEAVRAPIIEHGFDWRVWASALAATAAHCAVAFAFFVRFRGRIAFWG